MGFRDFFTAVLGFDSGFTSPLALVSPAAFFGAAGRARTPFGFAADAPVDTDRLLAVVQRGSGRFKITPDLQLSFRPEAVDWDGLIAETKTVLQGLRAAC